MEIPLGVFVLGTIFNIKRFSSFPRNWWVLDEPARRSTDLQLTWCEDSDGEAALRNVAGCVGGRVLDGR